MLSFRISIKASLAHEWIGHRGAEVAHRSFDRGSLSSPSLVNIALDEAQASIRAAHFAPLLTSIERYTLLRDSIARLKNQNLSIRQVRHFLYISNPWYFFKTMNTITPIFKLADILHTPEGIALAGAFPSENPHLSHVLDELKLSIDGLDSVAYFNNSQELISLSVKNLQYTTSIGNQVNLFFLLNHDNLPDDLTPGTIIYKDEQQNSTLGKVELSTSSN